MNFKGDVLKNKYLLVTFGRIKMLHKDTQQSYVIYKSIFTAISKFVYS